MASKPPCRSWCCGKFTCVWNCSTAGAPSASASATSEATAPGSRPAALAMISGRRAAASSFAASAIASGPATVAVGFGAREVGEYSNDSCASDSTSRGSVRYTGPWGSALVMARARSTTVSSWRKLRSS